jgi:predicted AlkP superfamily phosphohydrolase/phosphomutase
VEFIKKLFNRAPAKDRLMVLGLDSVPFSLLDRAIKQGFMPNLAELMGQGMAVHLDSVLPTVSPVAWASYATGSNPGKHGVFGFVDREPNPFSVHLPSAEDLKVTTLWDQFSRAGKKVCIVNVPLTYPPKQVNGVMVSCNMSPELAKATHPVELAPRLMELDYRIDANLSLAKEDKGAFLANLVETMRRRFEAAFYLMKSQDWDFFHLHVFSTDRLNYFFWPQNKSFSEEGNQGFWTFYRHLDANLGELISQLPKGARMALVSQYGCAKTKGLVHLNHWLAENGYLLFAPGKKELASMLPSSKAYSLVPGRIYINLEEREQRGSVKAGQPYEDLREELINRLSALGHPDTGEPLIARVYRREEIYEGSQVSRSADLIVEPTSGYDLKASLDVSGTLTEPDLPGMHVREGGFFFLEGAEEMAMNVESPTIMDLAPTFMILLGLEPPPALDGQSLV